MKEKELAFSGLSRFLAGIIFYTREVLLTSVSFQNWRID